MGHDEAQDQPVVSEQYKGQLRAVAAFARGVGVLVVAAFLCAAVYLALAGRIGPRFYWSLFLVLYGGCVLKASEAHRKP